MKKIIIIGSGIVGATAAYRLAKAGMEVHVIDREESGQATNAAAGIISPWFAQRKNKAWYHLAKSGAKLYPELISELKSDGEEHTGYKKVGALRLFTNEDKLCAAKERIIERQKDAPEIGTIHVLQPNDTKERFPLAEAEYHSIYVSGGARVDGRALRNALINGATKHGALFYTGNAELLYENKKINGVRFNKSVMEADTVIAATGAWMKELLQPIGVNVLIYPQKAQIIHLELPNTDTSKWPVVMPPNNQYFLALDSNRIVVGATHEKKAGFDKRITAGGVHEVLSKALEIMPGLAQATILETRVGFRPFTQNSIPIIGAIPGIENLLVANGLGASGLTTGPFVGSQLANLVLNKTLDIDLNEYSVEKTMKN
ncbi:NAD(P)/FAD-dependent oxidoreductase [Virgibacillus sp. W0430]|uniref:NAD(P)/FAD-dependent oxidoreductase n=1 Tax=Virgibacillus sp. W0430 TaxID=3391580 RepID=UPI003F47D20A